VLHHLADPETGLRALRNVLAPNGAMQLMVYAAYGRAGIYMMQEYCRLVGVDASETELRDLGSTIGALSADHPIAAVVRRTKDFTYPDAVADALLHPQIAPTRCRSSIAGWSGAASSSGAGSSRRPIFHSAAQSRGCRMPHVSPRFHHHCNTLRSNCCAGP